MMDLGIDPAVWVWFGLDPRLQPRSTQPDGHKQSGILHLEVTGSAINPGFKIQDTG